MSFKSVCLILGALCLSALPALANDVTFTDGTFNLANYSETAPFLSNGSVTLNFDQCGTCGNPGKALQIFSSFTNDGGTAAIGFLGNSFTFNPGVQGAITSIDASVDKDLTLSSADPGGSDTFHPLIEQDGNFYMASIAGPTFGNNLTTGFLTLSQTGLTAADFVQYDFATGTFGTAHPNFDGDPMTFGLGQIFGINSGAGSESFEADYDNLSLGINTVPEPGTIALLAFGLPLLGYAAAKRRSAAGRNS